MPEPAPARTRRRRFRQPSAVVLGLVVVAAVLVLGVTAWSTVHGAGASLLILALVPLLLALLVWPSVELDQHGVTLRNVVVDTVIPWSVVDDCETRWNLRVWTATKAYSAWAISASRRGHLPQHHMMAASMNPMNMGRPGRVDAAAQAGVERHAQKVHAASVADAIESAKAEYDSLVVAGDLPPVAGGVRRVVSPVSAGLVGLAAAMAAVGALLLVA